MFVEPTEGCCSDPSPEKCTLRVSTTIHAVLECDSLSCHSVAETTCDKGGNRDCDRLVSFSQSRNATSVGRVQGGGCGPRAASEGGWFGCPLSLTHILSSSHMGPRQNHWLHANRQPPCRIFTEVASRRSLCSGGVFYLHPRFVLSQLPL
jgi:hypothetical protein